MPAIFAECFLLAASEGRVVFDEGPAEDFAPSWSSEVAAGRPQEVIVATAPIVLSGPPHSTSWRMEGNDLRLTFVAFPGDAATLRRPRPVPVYRRATTGSDEIPPAAVVGHAVRHVAFLAATDDGFWCPPEIRHASHSAGHLPDVFRDLTPT